MRSALTLCLGFLLGLLVMCDRGGGTIAGPERRDDPVAWRGARVDATLVPTLDAAWAYRGGGLPSLAERGDWEPVGWTIRVEPAPFIDRCPLPQPCRGTASEWGRLIRAVAEVDAVAWELSNARCLDLRGRSEFAQDRGWWCS